mmetsp:Transcript_19722/g.41023  ORF Transcript_19722/g.41023 Transcript_19722/m.41023 type:complete len:204 (+) Transcript_19722:2-613(+)
MAVNKVCMKIAGAAYIVAWLLILVITLTVLSNGNKSSPWMSLVAMAVGGLMGCFLIFGLLGLCTGCSSNACSSQDVNRKMLKAGACVIVLGLICGAVMQMEVPEPGGDCCEDEKVSTLLDDGYCKDMTDHLAAMRGCCAVISAANGHRRDLPLCSDARDSVALYGYCVLATSSLFLAGCCTSFFGLFSGRAEAREVEYSLLAA